MPQHKLWCFGRSFCLSLDVGSRCYESLHILDTISKDHYFQIGFSTMDAFPDTFDVHRAVRCKNLIVGNGTSSFSKRGQELRDVKCQQAFPGSCATHPPAAKIQRLVDSSSSFHSNAFIFPSISLATLHVALSMCISPHLFVD